MKRNEQMKEMREGRVKRHEERKRNTQICYKIERREGRVKRQGETMKESDGPRDNLSG
jgi:hypothetical protein